MHKRQTILLNAYLRQALILGYLALFFIGKSFSQSVDTLPNLKIKGIKIKDAHSPLPSQYLGRETISQLNSLSVADAVKFFPGVVVKDYGGIGGLKTVSVRSLGANNTAIMYDGVLISDAQNGQIDLGKISLDNIDNIALYSAQPDELILPARTFSASSVIVLKTSTPTSNSNQHLTGRVAVKTGSFGFISPAIFLQYTPGKHFYQQVSTEFQHADGHYKFTGYETGSGKVTRTNTSVDALRIEYDAGYSLKDSSVIKFKSYYYNSNRGLPGAVILYNSQTHETLSDENFFVQSSWRKNFLSPGSVLFNVKYSINKNKYTDPDFPNSQGGIENKFRQDEYYLSGVYGSTGSKLSWSYGSDIVVATLKRLDDFSQGFVSPTRSTWLNNLSASFKNNATELKGNLLYSRISDKVKSGTGGQDVNVLSPTVALVVSPLRSVPVSFRAFYKNIFRVPTFNDLYYTFIGNSSLRPEYAKQYNLGVTYTTHPDHLLQAMIFTSDFYINNVRDKILAVPRQNLFQWTMLNIGKVEIKGIDATVHLYSKKVKNGIISSRLSYSYQSALDKSIGSASYNNQLPYTPKHSGSVSAQFSGDRLSLGYNIILSGYRYRLGEQTSENLVKEWATQDVNISYRFYSKTSLKYKITAEANNIFNKQYEVVRYYPMPGFNFRVGLTIQF